ncbi:MAG: hypothetical protein DLM68_09785 [Hyphomicrobiales bacterium]|nr:MAG: hypothetical protein DLM68_09785 [Hyphomicrobiales bacterium]
MSLIPNERIKLTAALLNGLAGAAAAAASIVPLVAIFLWYLECANQQKFLVRWSRILAFRWCGATSHCKVPLTEPEAVTDFQLFGRFIALLMLFVVGVAVAWFADWQARHDERP